MRFSQTLIISVRVPEPTDWMIREKCNKRTLLKSVARHRKTIGVVLCPGVCNKRGITTPRSEGQGRSGEPGDREAV